MPFSTYLVYIDYILKDFFCIIKLKIRIPSQKKHVRYSCIVLNLKKAYWGVVVFLVRSQGGSK